MAGNTFGVLFRLTTFGESHGEAIGGIIDGCPAGLRIDVNFIQHELNRRKPAQSHITSQRKEEDKVMLLSGIFKERTLGSPIGFIIRNEDQKPSDYEHIRETYRPSHADYTYDMKYGIRDYRGGGRASARETAVRVVAGAIAKLLLKEYGMHIQGYVSQVGEIKLSKFYKELDLSKTEKSVVRCPDEQTSSDILKRIEQVKKEGDTLGGIITCIVSGVPAGLGEPVFDKLHADIGKAMLSINAVKGFEYGSGFEGVEKKGSEQNDRFVASNVSKGSSVTATNNSGGIQGGISNGEDIYFRVAFKPVATLMQKQTTVNTKGEKLEIIGKGRHDPCVVPRAVPIVEAMAALVFADHLLRAKTSKVE